MRQTAKALKSYFGSFGLPAYANESVPDDVTMPYIVYPLKQPVWNEKTTMYCIVWYRTTGYAQLLAKVDEILADLEEGRRIETDDGFVMLYPEPTLVQEYHDTENGARGMYISMSMNSYHIPGV